MEVFDNTNAKMGYRVFVGCLLMTMSALSGIDAIAFYAHSILNIYFGTCASIIGNLVLMIINFLSTFVAVFYIERKGRALILYTGAIIMCVALVAVAILASMKDGGSAIGISVAVFFALYVFGFAYSWGPVCWVVCAEMFPIRERGKANSLTIFSMWFWTTIVGAIFPFAASASLSGCFAFFAGVIFLAALFVYLYLPETANRTATEIDVIDELYETHKPEFPRKKWL